MVDLEIIREKLKALLPEQAKWEFKETWVSFDFSRLKHSLIRVTDEQTVGPPVPADWHKYRVFGDEFFSNGSAFICIDETEGSVQRIDMELKSPIGLFATNTDQFAATFQILDQYFALQTEAPEELAKQLRLADAEAFDAGSDWRLLSDHLNSED